MISFVLRRLSAAVVVFARAAFAQDFPKRPITMIVPYAAIAIGNAGLLEFGL